MLGETAANTIVREDATKYRARNEPPRGQRSMVSLPIVVRGMASVFDKQ